MGCAQTVGATGDAMRRINLGCAAMVLRDFVEGDSVAEAVELFDQSVASMVRVVAVGEVVAAEVLVVGVLGEEVPADDQDRVGDGDGGFLLADPAGETPELGRQVGVAGSGPQTTRIGRGCRGATRRPWWSCPSLVCLR